MRLRTVIVNPSQNRAKNQAFIYSHRGPYLFNLIYLTVIYLASFTLHQIQLLLSIQSQSYVELPKLYISFNYLIFINYNDVSEYYLLITHTYNYIYET